MNLDNSAFTLYMRCPKMYFERYEADGTELVKLQGLYVTKGSERTGETVKEAGAVRPAVHGIELAARSRDGLDFGTRFHALADNARRIGLGHPVRDLHLSNATKRGLDDECDATFAAYEQHWLGSELTYIESEKTHVIPLPKTEHNVVVKIDAVCRFPDWTIGPLDTKTESKPGYNFREDWAGKTQASIYLWALTQLYPGEKVSRLVVDVVTRGNSRRAPSFARIDDISRTPAELEDAIRNFAWVCADIEASRQSGWWRSNMNICKDGWKRCDYYDLHVYGRTESTLKLYKPAEAYLDV